MESPRKKYSCTICARAFARSEHCSRHERTHTKEKPFACRHCKKTYGRKDLVKRHEETIHADRRGVGRVVQVPVHLPTPPSDEGSHIDSADHALQYLDPEVAFANEVQFSPVFDSNPAINLDYDFGTVQTQQPTESFPDYAIDPTLDMLQFSMTREDVTGFPSQPYYSTPLEQHEQPQLFDSRPAKRMRQSDALFIQPALDLGATSLGSIELSSPDSFAMTTDDWHYPCVNIGDIAGRDPSLPTTFG